MTLTVTINATNGDGSKAVSISHSDGNADEIIKVNGTATITVHQSKSITISEIDTPVEVAAEAPQIEQPEQTEEAAQPAA